jgi:hypothetical protein
MAEVKNVAIIGSFRKHYPVVLEAFNAFEWALGSGRQVGIGVGPNAANLRKYPLPPVSYETQVEGF